MVNVSIRHQVIQSRVLQSDSVYNTSEIQRWLKRSNCKGQTPLHRFEL